MAQQPYWHLKPRSLHHHTLSLIANLPLWCRIRASPLGFQPHFYPCLRLPNQDKQLMQVPFIPDRVILPLIQRIIAPNKVNITPKDGGSSITSRRAGFPFKDSWSLSHRHYDTIGKSLPILTTCLSLIYWVLISQSFSSHCPKKLLPRLVSALTGALIRSQKFWVRRKGRTFGWANVACFGTVDWWVTSLLSFPQVAL